MPEIKEIVDEMGKNNPVRLRIRFKKGTDLNIMFNRLCKETTLQSSFPSIFVAIKNNKFDWFELKSSLKNFIKFRIRTIKKVAKFELKKLEERREILEGLMKALSKIDRIIKIIKGSKNTKLAKDSLIAKFSFTELQVDKILEMKLAKLTKLESSSIKEDLDKVKTDIKTRKKLLSDNKYVKLQIIAEQKEIMKHSEPRKTSIENISEVTVEEDYIENEKYIVTMLGNNYIKKTPINEFKVQNRGGIGRSVQSKNFVKTIDEAENHDYLFIFTESGLVFRKRLWEISESSFASQGKHIGNYIDLPEKEDVANVVFVSRKELESNTRRFLMITKKGFIKLTNLNEFKNYRKNGIIGSKVRTKDKLIDVRLIGKKDRDIIIGSKRGKCIRISTSIVPTIKRPTFGVKSLNLAKKDYVTAIDFIDRDATHVCVITKNGRGKITPIEMYGKVKSRIVKGYTAMTFDDDDQLLGLLAVNTDQIITLSSKEKTISVAVDTLSEQKARRTKGSKIIKTSCNLIAVGKWNKE